MKKLLTGLSAFLLFSPLHVFAADGALSDTALGTTLPLWSCIPFCWNAPEYCHISSDKRRMVGKA